MKKFFLALLFLGFSVPMAMAKSLSVPQKTSVIPPCVSAPFPQNIDMTKVRNTWLSWYNQARAKLGLAAYTIDPTLNLTATDWSAYSEKKGSITHTRTGSKAYYDYNRILAWFSHLGVTFPTRVGDSAYTENIGWDYYSCSQSDCTASLISAIHSTYAFFIGEKNKKYRPHYESIMDKNFKKIGIGIAIDPVKKKYYITVHYSTTVAQSQNSCLSSI